MCSLILIALNTFLATPACVAPDGAATLAAQEWGGYTLQAQGYGGIVSTYEKSETTVTAGAYSRPTAGGLAQRSEPFVGFTWFADSFTLVVEDTRF